MLSVPLVPKRTLKIGENNTVIMSSKTKKKILILVLVVPAVLWERNLKIYHILRNSKYRTVQATCTGTRYKLQLTSYKNYGTSTRSRNM